MRIERRKSQSVEDEEKEREQGRSKCYPSPNNELQLQQYLQQTTSV